MVRGGALAHWLSQLQTLLRSDPPYLLQACPGSSWHVPLTGALVSGESCLVKQLSPLSSQTAQESLFMCPFAVSPRQVLAVTTTPPVFKGALCNHQHLLAAWD